MASTGTATSFIDVPNTRRWATWAVVAVILHVILFQITFDVPTVVPKLEPIVITLSDLEDEPVAPPQPEVMQAPKSMPLVPPGPEPAPMPETADKPELPEQPEQEPEAKPVEEEAAKPEQPPEPDLAPDPQNEPSGVNTGFQAVEPDVAPPEQGIASNVDSRAKDLFKGDLPEGAPHNEDGETNQLINLGRSGETDTEAKIDYKAGSATTEGVRDAGNPDVPDEQDAKAPTPIEDEPAKAEVAEAVDLPEPDEPAKTAPVPEIAPEPTAPTPPEGERVALSPEAPDTAEKPQTGAEEPKDLQPDPDALMEEESKNLAAPDPGQLETPKPPERAEIRIPLKPQETEPAAPPPEKTPDPLQVQPEKAPAKKKDPEDPALAELMGLFDKEKPTPPKASPEMPDEKIGAAGREGDGAYEGDGRVREGTIKGANDLQTWNISTSARETGKPAFASRREAEVAYIERFYKRVNDKWKARVVAKGIRTWHGVVVMKVTIQKDGTLVETAEMPDRRLGAVDDEAVAQCKLAIEAAAPLQKFGVDMAGRETITHYFSFQY